MINSHPLVKEINMDLLQMESSLSGEDNKKSLDYLLIKISWNSYSKSNLSYEEFNQHLVNDLFEDEILVRYIPDSKEKRLYRNLLILRNELNYTTSQLQHLLDLYSKKFIEEKYVIITDSFSDE